MGLVVLVFEGQGVIHHLGAIMRGGCLNSSESTELINNNEQNKMQMAWKESIVMNGISPQILIEMKMRCIFNMCLIEYT